jgi:hypothetical protein
MHSNKYIFYLSFIKDTKPMKALFSTQVYSLRNFQKEKKRFFMSCRRTSQINCTNPASYTEGSMFKYLRGHHVSKIPHSFLQPLQLNSGIVP